MFRQSWNSAITDPEKEPMVDLSELQQVIGIDMNAERFVDFDNNLLTSDEDGSLTSNNKEDESCDTDKEVTLICEENKKSYREMLISSKELEDCSLTKGNTDLYNSLHGAIGNVENCILQEKREDRQK
ncbi:uncharacterized protein LOC124163794 [Ischnura elegans]|uniref:uncharacterized protein LOC124163794 n=1 Tax=Ischnura elegans TaxID=197161 RepID=UPI001ED8994F|nr:uncharacterized protein LOC124163794 [Ischnura elegans]